MRLTFGECHKFPDTRYNVNRNNALRGVYMFNNRSSDGRNNVCGKNIAALRKQQGISQRELAQRLQLMGYDMDKNAVQRVESGQRFVTDIEVEAFAKVFGVSLPMLFRETLSPEDFSSENLAPKKDSEE